jgi:uncharacterized circularly permuted ATP-grasp superfamily protein
MYYRFGGVVAMIDNLPFGTRQESNMSTSPMNKVERNNQIVRMKACGSSVAHIAKVLGVSPNIVERVLSRNVHNITSEPPPNGMSVRTAFLIQSTFGVWPSVESIGQLSGRLAEYRIAPGTQRIHWEQFAEWLSRQGSNGSLDLK